MKILNLYGKSRGFELSNGAEWDVTLVTVNPLYLEVAASIFTLMVLIFDSF